MVSVGLNPTYCMWQILLHIFMKLAVSYCNADGDKVVSESELEWL